MDTAMMTLKKWVDDNYPNFGKADIEAKIDEMIEDEKQQIIDARISVTGLNHASPIDDNSLQDAEDYFNSKYN